MAALGQVYRYVWKKSESKKDRQKKTQKIDLKNCSLLKRKRLLFIPSNKVETTELTVHHTEFVK